MLKKFLRKWLEVPSKPKQRDYTKEMEEATEQALAKLDRSFTQRIARFSIVHCYKCNKGVIGGRDAVYSNWEGKKFCSHKCIDKNKEES